MKAKLLWAVLAVVMGAGAYAGISLATNPSGQSTTTLAKATVGSLDLTGHAVTTTVGPDGKVHPSGLWLAWIKTHGASDLYVVDNKFVPGGTTGYHSHPGPSIIFVVAGSITNYSTDDGCKPETYAAGTSFVDPGGDDAHMLRNDGSVNAETIAVQFIPQGVNRRTDVTDVPAGCPS